MTHGKEACIQQDDAALGACDDQSLCARLACRDWENDPRFVPDEQVFRMFRRAEAASDLARVGLLSRELGRRILGHAKSFVYRSGIYRSFESLEQAAEELSQYVWERLVKQPKDAAYAEKRFGRLFKCRALDFQRRVLAKKRSRQVSLDDMAHATANADDEENPNLTVCNVPALRQEDTLLDAFETKQRAAQAAARLQEILTKNEHSTFVMLFVEDLKVREVAVALRVSERSINNYKNAALKKVRKEFNT